MKEFYYNYRRSAQLRKWLQNAIDWHEQLKGSYFFAPKQQANRRRQTEKYVMERHPPFKIIMNGGADCITVQPSYSESASHVYYQLRIDKNGDKRTIAELKNLLGNRRSKNAS
jgi:hypothetical protein